MFTVLIIGVIVTGVILFSIDSKVRAAMGGGHRTVCPRWQKLTQTVFSHSVQQRDSSEDTQFGTTKK